MDQKKDVQNVSTHLYYYEDEFTEEDIAERLLYLNKEINEQTIEEISYHIYRFNRHDAGKKKEDRKPIIIFINSPGGSVVDGFGVVDAIETSLTPVYTVNMAACESMGFLIYIAGHKRFAFPRSEFLLHEIVTGGSGTASKVRDRIEFESVQLDEVIRKHVTGKTKISEKTYAKKAHNEWYFFAEEAKSLGVVDYIIGADCTIDDLFCR